MNNVFLPAGFPMPEGALNGRLLFIDVEASGLYEGSYPIEFAAVSVGLEVFEDFLIRPAAHWTDWKWESAQVHKIRREQLLTDGINHIEAADRVMALFNDGYVLVSDNPGQDGELWLRELLHSAGVEKSQHPVVKTFTSTDISEPTPHWNDLFRLSRKAVNGRHRAGPDATALALTWRMAYDPDYQARVSEHLGLDADDVSLGFQP